MKKFKNKNNSETEAKRKLVVADNSLINKSMVAAKFKCSNTQITQVINGDRTDRNGILDFCLNLIGAIKGVIE